ncbi:MAG: hypothetical protein DRN18_00065, partial [Thermoplasmata archaeon]
MRKTSSIIILLLLLFQLLIVFVPPTTQTSKAWWNTDWAYYKVCYINTNGYSGYYQMKLNVSYNGGGDVSCEEHCQSDFDDIRFVDIDNTTVLPYWKETYVDSQYAIFWINVSADAMSDGKILMYYGNPSATDESDGDDTFLFFDDFEGTSLDTTKWNSYTSDGEIIVEDSLCKLHGTSSSAQVEIYSKTTFSECIVEARIKAVDKTNILSLNDKAFVGEGGASNYFGIARNPTVYSNFWTYSNDGTGEVRQQTSLAYDDNFHRFKLVYASDSFTYIDDDYEIDTSKDPSGNLKVYSRLLQSTNTEEIDWVFVRKYASTEPTWSSFGSEETDAPSISNPYPADGSIDVELQPTCHIDVSDPNGDTMTIYWYENSTGSWVLRQTNSSVGNGTYYWTFTQANEEKTTYWWKVAVNDGTYNVTQVYKFTTKEEEASPSDFDAYVTLTIDHTQVEEDLTNFPVLVYNESWIAGLNETSFTFFQPDGTTECYWELEEYDPSTGKLVAWVNISSISSTEDTTFYLYYDTSPSSDGGEHYPERTWDSNYICVYHGDDLNDSTANHYNLINVNGTSIVDGWIGKCFDFEVDNHQYLYNDSWFNLSTSGECTIVAWFNVESVTDSSPNWYVGIHAGIDSSDDAGLYLRYRTSTDQKFQALQQDDSGGLGVIATDTFVTNTWYHLAGLYDNSASVELYVDGVSQGTASGTIDWNDFHNELHIGHNIFDGGSKEYYFDGKMDEIRISKVKRSSGWIKTVYNNLKNKTTFVKFPTTPQNITVSNPHPSDGSTGVSFSPIDGVQTSVTVSHSDGKTMNIYWYWKNGTTWELYGQNLSVTNGTYKMWMGIMLDSSTTYYWSVNVTDNDGNWTNRTYSFTTDAKPFILANTPDHYNVYAHFREPDSDATTQWHDPDILYFPEGWGNVNGTKYKYWLAVTGYPNGNEDYEQPSILVCNNLSNNSWVEPANNYYHTNPVTGWYWDDGDDVGGHFCDPELVYNDDTDELYLYIINSTRGSPDRAWIELYKSSDGVNWTYVTSFFNNTNSETTDYKFMCFSIVKEGSIWRMWGVCLRADPHTIHYWTSTDGIHWTYEGDLGSSMAIVEPWHMNVHKYDGIYWMLLTEETTGNPASLIYSFDGENWNKYDDFVLKRSSSGWDNGIVYVCDFIIENGNMTVLYTGKSSSGQWHTSYPTYANMGGSGYSDNIIFIENHPPIQSNPSPSDGATDVPVSLSQLSIDISDPEGDLMNWSIETSPNIGSASGNNAGNGTITCPVSGLEYGTTYTWYVNVTDGHDWTNETYTFTTETPDPPSNLKAVSVNTSTISLTWTKSPDTDVTVIVRKTGNYPTSPSDGTVIYNGTAESYVDSDLSPGTVYYYRAWSYAPNSYSSSYTQDMNYTYPDKPTSISSSATGYTISLYWNRGDGADYTVIRYSTSGYPTSPSEGTFAYNNTGTSTTVSGLSPGTTYYFSFWAYDSESGYYSQEYTTHTATTPYVPPDPSNLVATTVNDTKISLTWSASTDVNSVLVRKIGSYPSSPSDGTVIFNSSGTSYVDTGLSPSTHYYYRVWTYNQGVYSENYAEDEAWTKPQPPQDVDYNLEANGTTANLTITWTKGQGADKTVIRKSANSFPSSPSDGTLIYNGTGESYTDANIDQTWYYRLWSYNETTGMYSEGANLTFFACWLNCYNESSGEAIENWSVFISDMNGSQVYTAENLQNSHILNISQIPQGLVSFKFTADGYKFRLYYYEVTQNSSFTINAYLPPESANPTLYLLYVKDVYDSPIRDALISVRHYDPASSTYVEVARLYTDAEG